MSSRKQFKMFLRRLDPQATALDTLQAPWFVPMESSPGRLIARQLELDENRSHLLNGEIGTGKSTQLAIASGMLESSGVAVAVLDASEVHSLTHFQADSLVALAGIALARHVGDSRGRGEELLEAAYHSETYEVASPLAEYGAAFSGLASAITTRRTSPVLRRPARARGASDIRDITASLRGEVAGPVVVLLDGLDRAPLSAKLGRAAASDLGWLRDMGIGFVAVGTSVMAREPDVASSFDHLTRCPIPDPTDPDEAQFLARMLLQRDEETQLLTPSAVVSLARASGGLLRDLVSLTRNAVDSAWMRGSGHVGEEDVLEAVRRMQDRLLLGLSDAQMARLEQVNIGMKRAAGEEDDYLLMTGRLVAHGPGGRRLSLHPVLADWFGGRV